MHDPFIGAWKLNPEKSQFDPNHRPSAATMTFEEDTEGYYLMKAEGIKANGEKATEQPVRFIPDGQERPLPGFPGLVTVHSRTDPNTIRAEAWREDGSLAGGGSYSVSEDGTTLTAAVFGFDSQLRQFQQQTTWERQ